MKSHQVNKVQEDDGIYNALNNWHQVNERDMMHPYDYSSRGQNIVPLKVFETSELGHTLDIRCIRYVQCLWTPLKMENKYKIIIIIFTFALKLQVQRH